MTSPAKLTVVLVNYNSGEWLDRCLASFSNLTDWKPEDTTIRVVLVDNASTDDSLGMVRAKYPWVEIQTLSENKGFSAGNNHALATATTPYVMLLNTDTEFLPGTDLIAFIDSNFSNPRVGVLSPRVEFSDGRLDHASHRGFPTPWNALMYFSGMANRFPKRKWATGYTLGWQDDTTAHEIEACTGAAMIVRTSAMKEVGLLDEAFFMYAEDIDWCLRFYEANWKIWYDPSVRVIHHKHKSGKGKKGSLETKIKTTSAFYDTMKQYFRKHNSGTPVLVLLLVFAIIDLLKYHKIEQERKLHVHE